MTIHTRSYSYRMHIKTRLITEVTISRHGWWRTLHLHLLEGIGHLYAWVFDVSGQRFEGPYIRRLLKTDRIRERTASKHSVPIPEDEEVQEVVKKIMYAQSNDYLEESRTD